MQPHFYPDTIRLNGKGKKRHTHGSGVATSSVLGVLPPSCVVASVWQTTCTRAAGLLFPWKKTQQMFCALECGQQELWPGSVQVTPCGYFTPPRAVMARRQKPLAQATASPLYRSLVGQPFGFRNADNPELHVRRPPPASAWPSRFKSRPLSSPSAYPAAVLSPVTSCYHFRLRATSLAAQGSVAGAQPPDPAAPALKLQLLHGVTQLRAVYPVALPP